MKIILPCTTLDDVFNSHDCRKVQAIIKDARRAFKEQHGDNLNITESMTVEDGQVVMTLTVKGEAREHKPVNFGGRI